MKHKQIKIAVFLIFSLFLVVTFYQLYYTSSVDVIEVIPATVLLGQRRNDYSAKISRFLYLVQTENCLPDNLASPEVIGDSSSCECDVLVLNYQERCSNISLPHVEYVFNSSTTWTTGRNLLYELAMKRDEIYHYYIFMDDDIKLYTLHETQNSWRKFENSLRTMEPAVGVLYKDWHVKHLYKLIKSKNCTLNESHEFLPTVYFDGALNAFHHKAVQYILPYSTKYDNISWGYSVFDAHIKSELTFRGQVVMHTSIFMRNPKHRPYIKDYIRFFNILQMVNDVVNTLPVEFQNATLVQEWRKYGREHEQMSSTLCLPPPKPHAPIVPYGHFDKIP